MIVAQVAQIAQGMTPIFQGDPVAIKELEHQILSLTFVEKAEILQILLRDFASVVTDSTRLTDGTNGSDTTAEQNGISDYTTKNALSPEEFEFITDRITDEFAAMVDATSPPLSDYAMSRASIYEDVEADCYTLQCFRRASS